MDRVPAAGAPRLLVIGLDGVPPGLLLGRERSVMPHLSRLIARGLHAPLLSCDPPVSVPSWVVMFTGVDPGTLGIYGFRHRKAGTYRTMYIPNSRNVPVPTVWELLSERGYRVALVGMPLGTPPPPLNGISIADFLTPAGRAGWTHPPELAREIEDRFGEYIFDVAFKSGPRARLRPELLRMTRRRFEIAEWIAAREPWDVFAIHEVGTDRLHHAFWRSFDRSDPRFVPGNPDRDVDLEYYAELDAGLGRLLRRFDDRTRVVVVSDHGTASMRGCFCINDWLEARGYLVRVPPLRPTEPPRREPEIDWSRTAAWGEGGYYARIYFNVRGREPQGIVPAVELDRWRRQLIRDLATIPGPRAGAPFPVRVLDPREIYARVRGDAPDLLVYFDGLSYRAAGSMDHASWFLAETDAGPDDAVHTPEGLFLFYDPEHPEERHGPPLHLLDVAPSLLDLMGEPVPAHFQGTVIGALRGWPGAAPAGPPVPAAAALPHP